jgi:hypothetical protein
MFAAVTKHTGETNMSTPRKPEFNVTADSVVAIGVDGVHYLWVFGADEWQAKQAAREAYETAHKGLSVVSLSGLDAQYDTGHAYIFFVADCFSPPLYLIFGDTFADAHETFVTEFEKLVKIEPEDLKDYTEDTIHTNDNGTPCDTEAVQYIAVSSVVIWDTQKKSV